MSPRPLRPRQVPRRHPADDRPAPPRCGAGADQAGRARHEGRARQGGHHQPGRGPARRPPARPSTTHRRSLLRDLKSRASQQQLKADFEAYLDGFSPNVQDILDNFEFRNQIPRLSKADALGHTDREVPRPGHQPQPATRSERRRLVKHPASTTTPWARSSRNWSAASTRRTTRRPASTGRRATPCKLMAKLDLPARSPTRSSPAPTCSTTAPAARAAC